MNIALDTLLLVTLWLVMIGIFLVIIALGLEFPGRMHESGFSKVMLILLLAGPVIAMSSDMPVVFSDNSILAINLGGALIPIFIASYFLYTKKMNPVPFGIIAAVAAYAAYSTSDFYYVDGDLVGIASDYPDFLIPGALAGAMALGLAYSVSFIFGNQEQYKSDDKRDEAARRLRSSLPLAFSAASIGTLIGADIVRIPRLMETEGNFFGSIGGAGWMDLVYLSGLIALLVAVPVYLFISGRDTPIPIAGTQKSELNSRQLAQSAQESYLRGNYEESVRLSVLSLEERTGLYKRRLANLMKISRRNQTRPPRRDWWIEEDHEHLGNLGKKGWQDQRSAYRALVTTRHLEADFVRRERTLFDNGSRRVAAYLIDVMIIGIAMFGIVEVLFLGGVIDFDIYTILSLDWVWLSEIADIQVLFFISMLGTIQLIYFTLFETLYAMTPGKYIAGICVFDANFERVGVLQAFSRNIFRFLDMFSFFYIVSIVMIITGKKRQRIGDLTASTVVVRFR